jgi:hypothetical protein
VLLTGLEDRGFIVTTTHDGKTEVELLGERIRIGVVERNRRVAHQLSVAEQRRKEKGLLHYAPSWDLVPTGQPILWVDHSHYGGRHFKDGKRKRLEDRLNEVVEALVSAARAEKDRRAAAERAERERAEARRRWQQAERASREELCKRERLHHLVTLWQRNLELRRFLSTLRASLTDRGTGSELDGWLAWANDYAERSDPLISLRRRLGKEVTLYYNDHGVYRIRREGFREPELTDYGQDKTRPGISISSQPSGSHWSPALELQLREDDVLPYEWAQDAAHEERTFRIPAAVLNRLLGLPLPESDDSAVD